VKSLPKTVTRQRHGCDLNPGPSAPESSTLTTWLPSHTEKGLVLAVRILSLRTESVLRLGFGTGEGSAMTFRGGAGVWGQMPYIRRLVASVFFIGFSDRQTGAAAARY